MTLEKTTRKRIDEWEVGVLRKWIGVWEVCVWGGIGLINGRLDCDSVVNHQEVDR